MERRYPLLDDRDLVLVRSMRGKHWIGPGIQVGFGNPLDEPLLWIPDALCGIALASATAIELPSLLWQHETTQVD